MIDSAWTDPAYPISPLQEEWIKVRTVQAFKMAEALISQRKRGAHYLTPTIIQDAVGRMMDQPMPEGFTWAEADYLLGE